MGVASRPPQDHVELIGQGPFGFRVVQVEPRHQAVPRLGVRNRVEDRVAGEQRISRKIHLRDQPCDEGGAEEREVNVRRPPGVGVVAPRIRGGLDGHEPIPPVRVGGAPAAAAEVGVERGRVVVDLVAVPSGRVGLPDLHERVRQRPAVGVHDPAEDDDPLSQRLPVMLPGQIVVHGSDLLMPVHGAGDLRQRMGQRYQRTLGRPQRRGAVLRMEVGRLLHGFIAFVSGVLVHAVVVPS